MRPTNTAGIGPDSPEKYRVADGLIDMIAKMAQGALRNGHDRYGWAVPQYPWLDVTAGPGLHPAIGCEGTPGIAMRRLASLSINTHATFIEGWPATCRQLEQYLATTYGPPVEGTHTVGAGNYRVVEGDSVAIAESVLATMPRSRIGGIITDPNGEVDFDLLARLANQPGRHGFDLLVYASATTLKRSRRAREVSGNGDTRNLMQLLEACNKGLWIVRKPTGSAQQWSWLIGTNWTKMPAWAKAEFAPVTSELGQQYLARLTYTDGERQHPMEFDE